MMRAESALFWGVTLLLSALMLGGCGTVPTPTPAPGPEPVDYSLVCQHLAELGCPEGRAPECATAFGTFQGSRMSDLAPVCLMAAQTKEAARACKSVLCE